MTRDEQKKRYRKALYVQPVERFTLSQIRSIHEASIKLLAETGMECAGEQAAGVYHSAGCRVSEIADGKQKRWKIQFPEEVLEKALRSVPSDVVLGARDPRNTLYLNAHIPAVYFGTGSEANIYLQSKIEQFTSQADSK